MNETLPDQISQLPPPSEQQEPLAPSLETPLPLAGVPPSIEQLPASLDPAYVLPQEVATEEAVVSFVHRPKPHEASAETVHVGAEISPRHHKQHLEKAAFVPHIESLPSAEQDLIGELLELGQTAVVDKPTAEHRFRAAIESDDPTLLDTALEKLVDSEGSYDPAAIKTVINTVKQLYQNEETISWGATQASGGAISKLSKALANRPELVTAMASEAMSGSASEWDKIAVGLTIAKAAEAKRTEHIESATNWFSEPETPTSDTANNALAEANEHASGALKAIAPELVPEIYQQLRDERLLRNYGTMEADGVTPAIAQSYELVIGHPAAAQSPSAEQVKTIVESFDTAPEALQQMVGEYTPFDNQRLLGISEYAEKLLPAGQKEVSLEDAQRVRKLAEILGCSRSTGEETAALGHQVVEDLLARGGSLEGIVDLVASERYLPIFTEAANRGDGSEYAVSLDLIAQLSKHSEIYDGLSAKPQNEFPDNRVLKELLLNPSQYKAAVSVIEQSFEGTVASGYPPELVADAALHVFSIYANNLHSRYSSEPKGFDIILADYLYNHFEAMQVIGDSSTQVSELLGSPYDQFESTLAMSIESAKARGEAYAIDGEAMRASLRGLGTEFASLKEEDSKAFNLLIKVTQLHAISLTEKEIPNLANLGRLARESGPEFAEYLLEKRGESLLAENIELFSGLGLDIADHMIARFKGDVILQSPDSFTGIELNQDLANKFVANGQLRTVFDNMDKFSGLDPLPIGEMAVEAGYAFDVLTRLSDFAGIENSQSENPNVQRFVKLINNSELMSLLGDTGPLNMLSKQFVCLYLGAENPNAVAAQIKQLGSGDNALWHINLEYSKLLVGEVGDVGFLSTYLVEAVPLSLPRADIAVRIDEIPKPVKLRDMDDDNRRMLLRPEAIEKYKDVSPNNIPFTDLNPETQEALLAYRLYESIATSRDVAAQEAASLRNQAFAEAGNFWQLGDLVHATASVANFRQILQSGVLCGETIGSSSARDSYPFNVDTVAISQAVLAEESHEGRLGALKNGGYGDIAVLLRRTPDSTDYGRETNGGMNEDHRLVFGAIPSTEIGAVMLRKDDPELASSVVDSVVESGMYTPVIDSQGAVILSYDQFMSRRADSNYESVKPRILDSSFKREGTQGGSNEGAMFVIPTNGEPQHYYVKFGDASGEKRDHLWTELLADSLYREVVPELVPQTEAVIVEGRLAKASRLVDTIEGTPVTNEARNAGFVMDTFLGNWDAVYNSANLVMTTDGRAMRIDTGNSLDFRARGGKKDTAQFGDTVSEIEVGGDAQNLGGGMRQMYPELTDQQISEQVAVLQTKLTDAKIDALVNSIRRPAAERQQLATTLKARRDYLAKRFLSSEQLAA